MRYVGWLGRQGKPIKSLRCPTCGKRHKVIKVDTQCGNCGAPGSVDHLLCPDCGQVLLHVQVVHISAEGDPKNWADLVMWTRPDNGRKVVHLRMLAKHELSRDERLKALRPVMDNLRLFNFGDPWKEILQTNVFLYGGDVTGPKPYVSEAAVLHIVDEVIVKLGEETRRFQEVMKQHTP